MKTSENTTLEKQQNPDVSRRELNLIKRNTIKILNSTNIDMEIKQVKWGTKKEHGLFAKKDLDTGTADAPYIIGEYIGNTLNEEEYKKEYPKDDPRYIYTVSKGNYIDVTDLTTSNNTRWINSAMKEETANAKVINFDGSIVINKEVPNDFQFFPEMQH